MPEDACLPWPVFEKFAENFDLYSLIPQDQLTGIFKHFTKKKSSETLSFDDFKSTLAIIANRSKSILGCDEPGPALNALLIKLDMTGTVKILKNKLKQFKNVKEERKKRGSAVRQEKVQKKNLEEKILEEKERIEKEFKGDELKIAEFKEKALDNSGKISEILPPEDNMKPASRESRFESGLFYD